MFWFVPLKLIRLVSDLLLHPARVCICAGHVFVCALLWMVLCVQYGMCTHACGDAFISTLIRTCCQATGLQMKTSSQVLIRWAWNKVGVVIIGLTVRPLYS